MVESGLITWRDISQTKVPPPPSDFVAVAIIFGGLSLFPESGAKFASAVGWGLVLATFLNLWSPATPTKLAIPGGTANIPSAAQQKGGAKTTITPAVASTTGQLA
jgi:hypothetical protein